MSDCSKLQKKFNFNSKQDVRKWLLLNHPDKNNNFSHPDLNNIMHCYTNNRFKYNKETNASTKYKPNNPKKIITKKKRDRIFTCMRKTANFSNIDNNFKFDKSTFNPKQLNDAIEFLYGFRDAVANADYADTTYHLLNYFFHDDPSRFLWANFTNSKESMDKANASFEASVRDKMFPLFSEFASCGEKPDLYNGFTLYWSKKKDFMPTFPKQ